MARPIIAEQSPQTHNLIRVNKSHFSVDVYTGTIEALIDAGLVTVDQIPGQPGMPKYSVSFYNGEKAIKTHKVPRGPGYLNIQRSAGSRTITARVGVCEEETARRIAAQKAKDNAWYSTREIYPGAAITSEEAYRATAERLLVELLMLGRTAYRIQADAHPFELTAGDGDRLLSALRQIMSIFRASQLQSVGGERAQIDAARNDDAFQSFLRLQCIPADGGDHA